MEQLLLYIAAGAGVGFAIGLTGIGGGSLMTPLLLLFGLPLPTAIGTDLLYASATKAGGAALQARRRNVDWRVARLLIAGSLPAAALTTLFLWWLGGNTSHLQALLTASLGSMLVLTALLLLFRRRIRARAISAPGPLLLWLQENRALLMPGAGALLGVLITLSSVGAGTVGTAILILLYPEFDASRIIGTELAHAVPLTLVAGLGHLWLGHVDFLLLGLLVAGALPAIALGTGLGCRLPEPALRGLLALTLLALGLKYLLF